jgi:hypothetical protein
MRNVTTVATTICVATAVYGIQSGGSQLWRFCHKPGTLKEG